MNWDQIAGKWKEVKGKAKEKWGKLTDDDIEVIAGKRDQLPASYNNATATAKTMLKRNWTISPTR